MPSTYHAHDQSRCEMGAGCGALGLSISPGTLLVQRPAPSLERLVGAYLQPLLALPHRCTRGEIAFGTRSC